MAKAIKGCINKDCKSYKKTPYKDTDNFCSKCGSPLYYVCKDCWMELPDNTQKYCVRCDSIRKDKNDELVKTISEEILKGAKVAAAFVTEGSKVVSKKTKEIIKDVKKETKKRSKKPKKTKKVNKKKKTRNV